jgi:transcriptional regulator with XRE-family HTH domain
MNILNKDCRKIKFSNLLERNRLEKGLTYQDMAAFLGVTYLQLHRWVNKKTMPHTNTLKACCEKFGVNILDFSKSKPAVNDSPKTKSKPAVDDSPETFVDLLDACILESSGTVYELAMDTGMVRATMYEWLNGNALPSRRKLDELVEGLKKLKRHSLKANNLVPSDESITRLYSLYEEEKRKKPRTRRRKAASEEGRNVATFIKFIEGTGVFDYIESGSWSHDVTMMGSCSVRTGVGEPRATISYLSKITSIDSVFARACDSMRVTGAKTAFVVVEKKVTNRLADLFDAHKISIVTNEQFIEAITVTLSNYHSLLELKPGAKRLNIPNFLAYYWKMLRAYLNGNKDVSDLFEKFNCIWSDRPVVPMFYR